MNTAKQCVLFFIRCFLPPFLQIFFSATLNRLCLIRKKIHLCDVSQTLFWFEFRVKVSLVRKRYVVYLHINVLNLFVCLCVCVCLCAALPNSNRVCGFYILQCAMCNEHHFVSKQSCFFFIFNSFSLFFIYIIIYASVLVD